MESILHSLFEETILWVPKLIGVALICAIFFVIAMITKTLIYNGAKSFRFDENLTSIFVRVSFIALMIFGIVTALGTIGINITAIVAGLGLTGFALGFALKDIISNLISGIFILLYRPFKIGNRIKITGYEGFVVFIDLRYTELDSEGNKVLIPNSKLFTDPIVVFR